MPTSSELHGAATLAPRRETAKAARAIRRTVIELAHASRGPHVGTALSCVDILSVLYFDILRLDPWETRDIAILSKAHGAMALYATLAERGILDRQLLAGYYRDTLPAHLDRLTGPGIETSGGSLGHGFSIGLGLAHGFRSRGEDRQVFVVCGDGEVQEGAIWEGALFAPKLKLSNFTAIIDANNLQGYGRPSEICASEPMAEKWRAFGWDAHEVDGHDLLALQAILSAPSGERPKAVIARTVKGRDVSFMEDQLIWHYYIVTDEHRAKALEELS